MLDVSISSMLMSGKTVFGTTSFVPVTSDYPCGRYYYPGFFNPSRKFYPSQPHNKAIHFRRNLTSFFIDHPGASDRTFINTYYDRKLDCLAPLFSLKPLKSNIILSSRNDELTYFFRNNSYFEKTRLFYNDSHALFPKNF